MTDRIWIVYRKVPDRRSSTGWRNRRVGWVRADSDIRASEISKQFFGDHLLLEEIGQTGLEFGMLD